MLRLNKKNDTNMLLSSIILRRDV